MLGTVPTIYFVSLRVQVGAGDGLNDCPSLDANRLTIEESSRHNECDDVYTSRNPCGILYDYKPRSADISEAYFVRDSYLRLGGPPPGPAIFLNDCGKSIND